MWKERSNPFILIEIGSRIRQVRLQQNLSQKVLAENAGVSLKVIQRLEKGSAISTINLIAVLRELRMLERLDLLFPEPVISPILLQKLAGKKRKRASKASTIDI